MATTLLLVSIVTFLVGQIAAQDTPAAIVISPPTIQTASPEQTVRMTCVAYGVPLPSSITWSRLSVDLASKLDDSTSGYKVFEDTTTVGGKQFRVSVLEICGVSLAETDEYFCTADNGVDGDGIASSQAKFFFSVVTDPESQPAAIVARPPASGDAVDYGNTIEAVCVAYGNPLPTITWSKQGCSDISCTTNAQMYNQVISYGDVMYRKSVLQLCNADDSNSGTYTCSADNGVDGDGIAPNSFTWQLKVNPKPYVSTSDYVLPTTTCPPSPTTPPSTSQQGGGPVPSASVQRITADSNLPEAGYQGILAVLIIVAVLLLVTVIVVVVIIIIMRRRSAGQGSGFAVSNQTYGRMN